MNEIKWSLEEQRTDFSKRKFLAVPLSGMIVWLIVGLAGLFLPDKTVVWVLFIGTGCIAYLGIFISRFTGENFLDKNKPKNEFDKLFLFSMVQSFMIFAIAIPFFLIEYSSLPMTIGILTGSMWIPFSWIIKHWVGWFHAVSRTLSVLVLWYMFPDHRFIIIPFTIVLVYLITLLILNDRRKINAFF